MTTSTLAPEQNATAWSNVADGTTVRRGAWTPRAREILTPDALRLIAKMHRRFDGERRELLEARTRRQSLYDAGSLPDYLDRTSAAVTGDWRVAPVPADLRRRRVEITGPVNSTKMVIKMLSRNELGDRADTAMLDFEDSMKPDWVNVVDGVHNVKQAADGSLTWIKSAAGGATEAVYALDPEDIAVLMVRVRGLHLDESNLRIDGKPVCGGIMDFVLCMVHSARTLIDQGKTPKYYVPKCEHYLEARWWNRLFLAVQEELGIPAGTLRATFLIETLPAAFQMEEILYELREHAAGLNVGRWDKIFSDIKVLKRHRDRVFADRASIGMDRPWMKNYAQRLVQICHRRGAFAIGGMAAFTPGKTAKRREQQTAKVVADKRWEAALGHDGCWVSHPFFIGPAMSAFTSDNQLDVKDPDFDYYPDLLPVSTPPRTMAGLRTNVRVGIGYLNGWNQGIGCVAWDDLMEDLATLEISRAQTWQWLAHEVELDDGTPVTAELMRRVFEEELARIHLEVEELMPGAEPEAVARVKAGFTQAKDDAVEIFTREQLAPFLAEASELV